MTPEEQRRAGVSPETIRLSIGIEHVQDILEDLDQALSVASPGSPTGSCRVEIRPRAHSTGESSILSETSSPETRAFEGATNGARQSRAAISVPGDVRSTSPAKAWARALEITAQATRDPARILPRAVAEWADKYGDAMALVSDQERLSFRALEARMNQYSRWALDAGVARGETVALMMGNRPEYFAIWLGLIQVGAIAALDQPQSTRVRASPRIESGRRATRHRRGRVR